MIELVVMGLLSFFTLIGFLYGVSWYVEQYRKREMEEFRKSIKRGAKSIKQSMDEDVEKYAN